MLLNILLPLFYPELDDAVLADGPEESRSSSQIPLRTVETFSRERVHPTLQLFCFLIFYLEDLDMTPSDYG